MGAFLAMTFGKRMIPVAALLLLGACGSEGEQPITRAIGALVAQIGQERADPLTQLTPAIVAGVADPFILVSLPARQTAATMAVFAQSETADGPRIDWRAGDGSSLVLQADIVIATRGLGADLFLAETGDLLAGLRAGSGQHLRRHSRLDGENRLVVTEFACNIRTGDTAEVDLIARKVVATILIEDCQPRSAEGQGFTNTYWRAEQTGEMVQSEQWIGPDLGTLQIRHLKR